MSQILGDLEGVIFQADDILVTQEEHEQRLTAVLSSLQKAGLTFGLGTWC